MSRKLIILSLLFVVGLVSFGLSIYLDPKLSFGQAMLSLGSEGLKTAILFVLIDYLIGDHERRKEERRRAHLDLDMAAGNKDAKMSDYLDRLEENGVIHVNLTPRHQLIACQFTNRVFESGKWEGTNLDKTQFTDCQLRQVVLFLVSFKEAIFENVIFSDVVIEKVNFEDSLFVNCKFERAHLGQAHCSGTRFSNCHFDEMEPRDFPKSGAEYIDCVGVTKID